MEKLIEIGKNMELEGQNLLNFVTEQQKIQIQERAAEREAAKAKREAEEAKTKREIDAKKDEEEAQRRFQLQLEKMKNEHEQQMEILRQNQITKPSYNAYMNAPMPELPMFDEVNDNIVDFLKRFERFAKSHNWNTSNYAVYLSALLTGKALKVYSRLEDSEATDYTKKTGLTQELQLN